MAGRRAGVVVLIVGALALAGCTAAPTEVDGSSGPTAGATGGGTAVDATRDPFPDPDDSTSNTCGMVSAYVSVLSNALTDRGAGLLDDDGYRARLQGSSELVSLLHSDDASISGPLDELATLARDDGGLDPTSDRYDRARVAVSDACEDAGSPVVISATRGAGG